MRSPVYIFGHKNPDTDSICSVIAYAELKRKLGIENVLACRLGKINKETKFVLDYFNIEPPILLDDIKIKLRDLDLYNPIRLKKNDPLKKAWDALQTSGGSRLMPIVDKKGRVEGIVSIGDITKIFMEISDEEVVSRHEIRFDNLMNILEGRLLNGEYPYENLCGSLYIGSVVSNEGTLTDKDIIITGKIENARFYANERTCGCIILTNDYFPIELEKAKCPIMCVKHTMFKTVSLINQAISVSSVMNKHKFEIFSTESYIEDIVEMIKSSVHRNFPVVDREGRLYGVISRRHLIEYDRKQVILIDHNERRQSVDGLEQANILEIIDHHRVADVQTDSPLYVRSEPVGCSATIVYKLFKENNIKIEKTTAGLLLSAILSDTIMFRSPTCTSEDKATAEILAEIAEISIEKYGGEMFKAGTSLSEYTPEEILAIDRKEFSFDKYLIYISQVNTLDFKTIVNNKQELIDAMNKFNDDKACDLSMLLITDILIGGSEILVAGKARELTSKAFGLKLEDDSIFLPGVVSRKKQIVPKLTLASQI